MSGGDDLRIKLAISYSVLENPDQALESMLHTVKFVVLSDESRATDCDYYQNQG